jgi:hypothetical protein
MGAPVARLRNWGAPERLWGFSSACVAFGVDHFLWILARSLIYVAKSGAVYMVPGGFPVDFKVVYFLTNSF